MSNEIRKVIADEIGIFDDATGRVIAGDYRTAERIIAALHAAGYEIVPKWRTDLEAAPKDGTPVRLYNAATGREYVASWMTSMEEGDGQWVYARHLSAESPVAFIVENPTLWKPITPPEPSDDEN